MSQSIHHLPSAFTISSCCPCSSALLQGRSRLRRCKPHRQPSQSVFGWGGIGNPNVSTLSLADVVIVVLWSKIWIQGENSSVLRKAPCLCSHVMRLWLLHIRNCVQKLGFRGCENIGNMNINVYERRLQTYLANGNDCEDNRIRFLGGWAKFFFQPAFWCFGPCVKTFETRNFKYYCQFAGTNFAKRLDAILWSFDEQTPTLTVKSREANQFLNSLSRNRCSPLVKSGLKYTEICQFWEFRSSLLTKITMLQTVLIENSPQFLI